MNTKSMRKKRKIKSDYWKEIMALEHPCYCCGEPRHPFLWFCTECITAKEAAYAEAREQGLDWVDVIILRDKRMAEARVKRGIVIDRKELEKRLDACAREETRLRELWGNAPDGE